MSINAIYACKLYRASSRKNKIKAAVSDPLNTELVVQLEEYLDDTYEAELESAQNKKTDEMLDTIDKDSENDESTIRPSEHSSSGGGGGSFSAPSGGFDAPDSDLSDKAAEVDKERAEALDTSDKDNDVEESTRLPKPAITSSTDIAAGVDAIIGLLNSREDTAGVCRGIVKDSELWLHYKDTINLNNVMEPVIALLNASDYGTLDFNRLARTENAIVFSISPIVKPVVPLEEVNETK